MNKVSHYFSTLSRLKKWLLSLLLIFTLIVFFISVIFSTQFGTRWALGQVAQLTGVKFGTVNGNLLTGLDIASVDLKSQALTLHGEKVSFRWQPLGLFLTIVSVQSFSAENISIQLPAASQEQKPETFEWPSLALPVRVSLNNVNLQNINIQQGETKFALDAISGSLSLGTFNLRANQFLVKNPQFSVATNGSVGLRYPYALKLKTQWDFLAAKDLKLAGSATIGGDIEKILLKHTLTQPLALQSNGFVAPALNGSANQPRLEINNIWSEQVVPGAFTNNAVVQEKIPFLKNLASMQGNLQAKGWLDSYVLQGNLRGKTAERELTADVALTGIYVAKKTDDLPNIALKIENFKVQAVPLAATSLPDEQSYLQLKGDISLSPHIKWDFILDGQHVDIGQIFVAWPSDLKIHAQSQGEFKEPQNFAISNAKMAIKDLNVQGSVRDLKLLATGDVQFDENQWQASAFDIALGANKLALKGKAGNSILVDWNLNAPLLSQIDPSITGSVVSTGQFSSEAIESITAKNKLTLNAEVKQFSWQGYSVATLNADLKSNLNNYQFTLNAQEVLLQQQLLSNVALDGKGNIEKHAFEGTIDAPAYGVLNFDLAGGWKDDQWRGEWRKLSVAIKKLPQWNLVKTTAMQTDKTQFVINDLCLMSANITQAPTTKNPTICSSVNWKAATGTSVSMDVLALPLRNVNKWLKAEAELSGELDATFSLQALNNKPATANLHVQTNAAELLYRFHGGTEDIYPIQRAVVDASLKNNQLTSTADLDLGRYGFIKADAKYAVTDKKIGGNITVALPDLSPLEALVPNFDNVQGAANAQLTLAGVLEKPEITGNFTISKGKANLPKLGLELKDISFDVVSQTAGLVNVNGQILSGDGRLMLKGIMTNMGAENWHCQGNIFGANITLINQAQLSATVSPNLTFTADAGAINLNGSTEIPWARVALKTLPSSATRVSQDVVVVKSNDPADIPVLQKNSIPFYTNVLLYFGDDVQFKGFGLDGRLSGKINLFKEENRQMLTTGFVAVNNGIYKAYGQELSIERGRLIFQGPYDDPGLDIRAVRNIDAAAQREGFKVGLDILGTLQNPKSTVFSVPSLNDKSAEMAFLLTGKPITELGAGDAYAILSSVRNMGVDDGPSITDDITRFFGIDEIAIKENTDLDQNALWVGKNITPRLMIRYVVGLINQEFTVGMSYQVTDRIKLEAESGESRSVDAIYKIER